MLGCGWSAASVLRLLLRRNAPSLKLSSSLRAGTRRILPRRDAAFAFRGRGCGVSWGGGRLWEGGRGDGLAASYGVAGFCMRRHCVRRTMQRGSEPVS